MPVRVTWSYVKKRFSGCVPLIPIALLALLAPYAIVELCTKFTERRARMGGKLERDSRWQLNTLLPLAF